MLATALSLDGDGPQATTAMWRQIVDIIAQAGDALPGDARRLAFDRLSTLQASVPVADRRLAAASLAGRTEDLDIVALLANDEPAVAAPFLSKTSLSPEAWTQLLPAIPPASRNILRNRRDLPVAADEMLARFAPGDLALPSAGEEARTEPGVSQIRDLVDRIAAYRQRVPPVRSPEPDDQAEFVTIDKFRFETTREGEIDWVDGAPREALLGLSIAEFDVERGAGVDGQAAGAWRRRAPFTDARLSVPGVGPVAGHWLMSGLPLFNPRDGRFCGYRGEARRPMVGERADAAGLATGMPADSLRQVVHELRTPLNAIHGFAEMLDRQILGPAAYSYRERARAIVGEAARLITMVDDLDTAARIDSNALPVGRETGTDLPRVARTVIDSHIASSAARGVRLTLAVGVDPGTVMLPEAMVERMLARLLAAVSGVASAGETILVELGGNVGGITYSVTRPVVLRGLEERQLLDPGYGPEGDWPAAPLLGLGFTLRLVARMAGQAGGALTILPDRFELILRPANEVADDLAG